MYLRVDLGDNLISPRQLGFLHIHLRLMNPTAGARRSCDRVHLGKDGRCRTHTDMSCRCFHDATRFLGIDLLLRRIYHSSQHRRRRLSWGRLGRYCERIQSGRLGGGRGGFRVMWLCNAAMATGARRYLYQIMYSVSLSWACFGLAVVLYGPAI